MMLSFASFVERINEDRVKLRFLTWDGTVIDQFVDRELTKQLKQKRYTDKQWETFHFEDMRFQPCIFTGHSLLDIAITFVPLEECNVKSMIKNSYPSRDTLYPNDHSVFTNERLSEVWLNQCKRFDPNLQHEIDVGKKDMPKLKKKPPHLRFDKTLIFRPSFHGHLLSFLSRMTKDAPKDKKFDIYVVPADEEKCDDSKSLMEYVQEYIERTVPTDEQLTDAIKNMTPEKFALYLREFLFKEENSRDSKEPERNASAD